MRRAESSCSWTIMFIRDGYCCCWNLCLVLCVFLLSSSAAVSSENKRRNSSRICFYSNQAGIRGTEVALYDYAHYTEVLLGFKSIILFPDKAITTEANNPSRSSLKKFRARFTVIFVSPSPRGRERAVENLGSTARKTGCGMLYVISAGTMNDRPSYPQSFDPNVPTAIHAVFYYQPFGVAYAAVSEYLGGKKRRSFVPHMVPTPPPLSLTVRLAYRSQFNHISNDTLVVCRHGGESSFNIPLAHVAVSKSISRWSPSKLQFIFMGTKRFHIDSSLKTVEESVHFVPSTADASEKDAFLSACDVMLHAREDGETFGLAIAEMSVRNRPVITFNHSNTAVEIAHIRTLGENGFYYTTVEELVSIIDRFVIDGIDRNRDYNMYRDYSPENVMQKFNQTFIEPCLKHGSRPWFRQQASSSYSSKTYARRFGKRKHKLYSY